jgi:hypothetical protein
MQEQPIIVSETCNTRIIYMFYVLIHVVIVLLFLHSILHRPGTLGIKFIISIYVMSLVDTHMYFGIFTDTFPMALNILLETFRNFTKSREYSIYSKVKDNHQCREKKFETESFSIYCFDAN